MVPLLRLLAIIVSLYWMGDLLRQFFAGAITMGHGEFNDQVVVTSLPGRLLALLMWGPFLAGIFIAGVRPGLFLEHRRLLPALLAAIFVAYVLFSVTHPYSLK